ncbi:hypothetical protein ACHAXR_004453 [Thalassiosira sp. AJA248-18]
MTIVATTDTRNSQWANDTTTFGHKMLSKMGWKGGDNGLGKHQQGTSTNLRAVRRAESLGIGAENDSFGDKGWQDTNAGFHGVLASLKREYSGGGVGVGSGSEEEEGGDEATKKKKRKKEEKKRRKKEEKRRAKNTNNSGSSDSDSGNNNNNNNSRGVRGLPQNKVQAGHARKMREAKDIRNKSAADMAAIFGVKADFYKQPRDWVNGDTATGGAGGADSCSSAGKDKKKKKKSKKNSKEKESNNSISEIDDGDKSRKEKKKKKRKRSSDGSSIDGEE